MKAVISLRAAAAAANKLDFVDAPKATILLRGLAANFTEEPSTENQVAELEKYLTDEDLIGEAKEPN